MDTDSLDSLVPLFKRGGVTVAGRSVTTLLNQFCLLDIRLFTNTIKDYSKNNVSVAFSPNPPTLSRHSIGQTNSLRCKAPSCIYTSATWWTYPNTLEMVLTIYTSGIGVGYLIVETADGMPALLTDQFATNGTFRYYCGAVKSFATGANFNIPFHVLFSTDATGLCTVYTNGSVVSTAQNVGTAPAFSNIYWGSYTDTNHAADSDLYLVRFYNDTISADEALALYESSRVRLWPGSPKRSGITSRAV